MIQEVSFHWVSAVQLLWIIPNSKWINIKTKQAYRKEEWKRTFEITSSLITDQSHAAGDTVKKS